MKPNSLEKAIILLKKTEIFRCADAETLLHRIASEGETAAFSRGDIIFSDKSYRPVIGLLLTGKANVKKGRAVINTLLPGSLFGAVTLFSGNSFYATEITAAAKCEILFLSRSLVCTLMAENSAVAESYIAYLSQRIYFLTGKIEEFTAGSAESRLAGYFLSNAQKSKEGCSFVQVDNLSHLARVLNIGRASLYRAFDFFENEGAVSREGKKVILTDEKKLIHATDNK